MVSPPADANSEPEPAAPEGIRKLAVGYGRGFMGGMLVGVPAMLTMELWWEGFFVPAWRLILLFTVNFGVLLILQHYSGLTHRKTIPGQIRAAVVAYAIGIVTSAVTLFALGVFHGDLHLRELAGKLLLQAVPVSIGASVTMSEFGEEQRKVKQRRARSGYWGALGMALAGAMLFGFAVSGTEEPLLIAEQLTFWRALGLMLLSLLQVHAIVYAVDFKEPSEGAGSRSHKLAVLREGISTYALSLLVGTYLLWTFQTIGAGTGMVAAVYAVIAIGFVTSLGAAAAELLI